MFDLSLYVALFASAFTSATLLPGSSEAALLAILITGKGSAFLLIIMATVGNVLGSLVNWAIGRSVTGIHGAKWLRIDTKALAKAQEWFERFGIWSLLFSWVPVVGDPFTLIAGMMRVNFWQFLVLVSIGKAFRYSFIVLAFFYWANH